MTVYQTIVNNINNGAYNKTTAKNIISNVFAQLQITSDEYTELMRLADNLPANVAEDETIVRITNLENSVKKLTELVDAIKKSVEEGSTTVTEPQPEHDGSEDDPIDAIAGMTYEKGKYYRDPENNEIYVCTETVAYAGLPHTAVNVYFNWVRLG